MSRTHQIRKIIAKQRGRGPVSIDQLIHHKSHRVSTEAEMASSAAFCREIIESVPVVFDRVREAASQRGISSVVEPLVHHAEGYFLADDDILPEKDLGELGLLDDAYVALSVVNLVQAERDPLLEVDLDGPITFLKQVLGDEVIGKLDGVVQQAQARLHESMARLREANRRITEAERERERSRRGAQPRPSPISRPSPGADRVQCGACSGSGSVTCSSCCGHGYHTQSYSRVDWEGNVEYVTENIPCGCGGGTSACGACGGSGWR